MTNVFASGFTHDNCFEPVPSSSPWWRTGGVGSTLRFNILSEKWPGGVFPFPLSKHSACVWSKHLISTIGAQINFQRQHTRTPLQLCVPVRPPHKARNPSTPMLKLWPFDLIDPRETWLEVGGGGSWLWYWWMLIECLTCPCIWFDWLQGLGFLTSLTLPGVERQRTFSGGSQGSGGQAGDDKAKLGAIGRRRTLSMEEYDVPRIRR